MTNESDQVLKKQKMTLVIGVIVIGTVIFALGKYITSNYQPAHSDFFKPNIDLPIDEFKSKEVWMDRLESQLNFLTQKQEYYETTLLEYKNKDLANEREKAELKKHLAQLKKEIQHSDEKILQFQLETQESINQVSNSRLAAEEIDFTQEDQQLAFSSQSNLIQPFSTPPSLGSGANDHFQSYNVEPPLLRPPLTEYTMPCEDKNELFSIQKRIPANVSVKAVLISSLDAVCRLDAQSDPIPVKLRILDDGHLPNGITVKLKGCLIGASAYGDISSERVYIRLENLTKINAEHQAIETLVTGYVSGEDGRFGMRGIVIDRSAKILKPALGSGLLAGISQTLQSAYTHPPRESISAYTIGADFAQNSAAGAGDAFNMLASYYIRRAEQVQPVLQINAGRVVDVTFTHGFSMGDIHAKDHLKKIREQSRRT